MTSSFIHRHLMRTVAIALCLMTSGPLVSSGFAQELQVRRWNHLPINRNFLTGSYTKTEGEITFDPVLRIEDAVSDIDTWLFAYVRAFELFDRTARFEVRQAWQEGTWSGLVNGTPASVRRSGWSDTFLRFAINLVGAPPLEGEEYAKYRATVDDETIVGLALGVQLPTGQYFDDKLINLGSNRITFRPQIGVQHRKHNWTFETTATAWIYTDNNSFFGDNKLEQDPFYTVDGNIEYKFDSGLWTSVSAGIGIGAQSTVNGLETDDYKENYAWAVSMGFPLTQSTSIRATYLERDHWSEIGTRSQSANIGILASW